MLTFSDEIKALSAAVAHAAIEAETARERMMNPNSRSGIALINRNKVTAWLKSKPATMAEISNHFGWKSGTANFYVRRLLDEDILEFKNVNGRRVYRVKK